LSADARTGVGEDEERIAAMRVGVIFGGRSVEHDVSVITALQAMEALSVHHEPVPLYVSRGGRWYSDPSLRHIESYPRDGEPDVQEVSLDLRGGAVRPLERPSRLPRRRQSTATTVEVFLPAAHGTLVEDGSLQGLLELCGVPYAGSRLTASALAMNKLITKTVLAAAGLPVLPAGRVRRGEWPEREGFVEVLDGESDLPVYVKPVSLGSSIGVTRCQTADQVASALELAFELDDEALIEPSVEGGIEVNCAVLGRPAAGSRVSVCEQPIRSGELLTFDDKYLRGAKGEGMSGAERLIPAPLDDEQTKAVQDLARETFEVIGCSGVARIDCLVTGEGAIYVNELNTIPGSFSFYLWEPAGLSFVDLLDEVIRFAFEEHGRLSDLTRTFRSVLLAGHAAAGVKSGSSS
jgi:D-alanine-D-alanine ligase